VFEGDCIPNDTSTKNLHQPIAPGGGQEYHLRAGKWITEIQV
jgi:hypothetical protein